MRTFILTAAMFFIGVAHGQQSGCINDRYGNPQCPPPGGLCVTNYLGEVRCSKADAGILLNRYGEAVCGPGRCVANSDGDVFCSSVARGSSGISSSGDPVCTSGCVAASADQCSAPGQ